MQLYIELICRGTVGFKEEWFIVLIDDEEVTKVIALLFSFLFNHKYVYVISI